MLTKRLAKVYIRRPNPLRVKDSKRLRKKLYAVDYVVSQSGTWDPHRFNKANIYIYLLYKRFKEDMLRVLEESKFKVRL